VLAGGGAKGLAHIAVLKALDELDIPVDYIAGTSAGGVIGGLYAAGYSGEDIEMLTQTIDWADLFKDDPPRSTQPFFAKKLDGRYQLELALRRGLPSAPRGLINGQKLFLLFSWLTFPYPSDLDFDRLPIPFRCVTVDLVTGRQVVLKSGSLARALRATMAIPSVLAPVEWGEHLLVDGGVLNNLPIDIVKDMGADIVIAVDLSGPLSPKKELGSADKVLGQTLLAVEIDQKKGKMENVDILIHPDMKGLGIMDFFFPEKLTKIREQGESAASQARPALQALKDKYRLSRSRERAARAATLAQTTPTLLYRSCVLDKITISGNEKISTSFISRLFNLKPGDRVDGAKLSRRVNELYTLGYFEAVQYDINPTAGPRIELRLTVRERPRGAIRLGLRYDNYLKLVAAIGFYFNNFPWPGLRLENELEAGGLTRIRSKISFPTKTLEFPVYPFLEVGYKDIPTRLYDGNGHILTTYKDRAWSAAAGFGILVKKDFNLETAYTLEAMDVDLQTKHAQPVRWWGVRDTLNKIRLTATIDTLDNMRIPKQGVLLRALYEGSYGFLGSDSPYRLAEASLDIYRTLAEKNTFRFYGYWGTSSGGTPFYKFLNQGRPAEFVGMQFDQLQGGTMKILRLDYCYNYTKSVHFKVMGNVALGFEQRWPEISYSPDVLWGVGAGIVISSPAGPLELLFSAGSKSLTEPRTPRGAVYLVLGAKF
jgi:NTE family protein